MQLRKYQQETIDAILSNLKMGVRHMLVTWATGTGKTVLAAQLPSVLKGALPGKLVFVAHTTELLQQAKDKIQAWNPELKIGLEKAESHADADCDVILACNASVGRTGSTRLSSFWDEVSVIVVDECAHILGGSYLKILEDSGVLLPNSTKLLIGLTATPRRRNVTRSQKNALTTLDDEDLISLKSVFQKIVYSYPLRKAIKDGFLVPLKGYRVNTSTSLDGIKIVAGDYQSDELASKVNTEERNLLAVRAWQDNAKDRPTAVFSVDIAHAKALAKAFCDQGVKAAAVWGTDEDRADKLTKFEAGEITVLASCSVLSEGWDSPRVSCIVLARPTCSGSLMTQQVGRGTRLCPGKTDCIILDLVDATKKNSLVTFPSLLGLNPNLDLHGQDVVKAAEALEAAQEKYPGVSFEGLTDITKIKAYVESVDLFANPYDEEVLAHTKLTWMRRADASYALAIPESKELSDSKQYARFLHEKLIVSVNELSEYELSITTTEMERRLGTYATLQEAFTSAEEVIQRCRPSRVKLLLRDAPWHTGPASEAAKRYLRKLTKKRPLLRCLCEGLHSGQCTICGKPGGITAGEAALALNVLKSK